MDKQQAIEQMLNQKVWAVVGATSNKEKYGYKIFKFLQKHGYTVYGVNPNVATIDEDACYTSIADLPEKPCAVDVVVPPKIGNQVLHDCKAAGVQNVWLQPGAQSPELMALGEQLGLIVVQDACVMVEIHNRRV